MWGFHGRLRNIKVSLNGFPLRTTRIFSLSPCVSWETWFSWLSKLINLSRQWFVPVPGRTDKSFHPQETLRMLYKLDEKWRAEIKEKGEKAVLEIEAGHFTPITELNHKISTGWTGNKTQYNILSMKNTTLLLPLLLFHLFTSHVEQVYRLNVTYLCFVTMAFTLITSKPDLLAA